MGNFGCSCSGFPKEDLMFDNLLNSEFEEVVEFQPETYKHPIRLGSQSHSVIESKSSTFNSESVYSVDIQGELNRVQKSIKEILVPRWCVLTAKNFKYFKNQYSALCKEKPLFDISTEKIVTGKAFTKRNKFYFEFSYTKFNGNFEVFKEADSRNRSKHSSEASSKKESMNSSFASIKIPTIHCINENKLETLMFSVPERNEWEKWSKSLLTCIRSNY